MCEEPMAPSELYTAEASASAAQAAADKDAADPDEEGVLARLLEKKSSKRETNPN